MKGLGPSSKQQTLAFCAALSQLWEIAHHLRPERKRRKGSEHHAYIVTCLALMDAIKSEGVLIQKLSPTCRAFRHPDVTRAMISDAIVRRTSSQKAPMKHVVYTVDQRMSLQVMRARREMLQGWTDQKAATWRQGVKVHNPNP